MFRFRVLIALLVAGAAAVFLIFGGGGGKNSASGCCAGHRGVCGCACCDGTPLSEICRDRVSGCGETESLPVSFVGEVVRVADGDTIEVRRAGRPVRIRLAEIDCPEKHQPFGRKAAQLTASLVSGKQVSVLVRDRDRYGRLVAEVSLPDGRSVNRELLKAGLAWWYRAYSEDRSLERLERDAAREKRGLWAESDPVPPWVFRRTRRR